MDKQQRSSSDSVLLIVPHTSYIYGLAVWRSTSASNFQRVLVIQKKAIRALVGLKPKDTCREAFKELKILTITSMYIRKVILHAVQSDEPGCRMITHTTHGMGTYSYYTLIG
ncbi:hypothetical protein J6590_071091 [Homalodisca vitripennis]|nr:hypothetical protein J6590_071091 [Homalodisca vitripennis]